MNRSDKGHRRFERRRTWVSRVSRSGGECGKFRLAVGVDGMIPGGL